VNPINLKEELKIGKKRVGVWGLGYIGFSSIAHFAKEGVLCIGTDILSHRVEAVNQGKATTPNLNFWLGFDTAQLARDGIKKATTDWKELIKEDIAVHLITIPTEMDGKPYHDILIDVINKLSEYKNIKTEQPPLVIVESTLTPTVTDNIVIPTFEKNGLKVGKDILLGIAPRRDWFTSPDKGLKHLPRVVGGTNKETTKLMSEVLSIICDKVIEAQDHKHAAIVKSIENAFRQLDITFANQLSLAYPDMNITEVLKMVGTKWNVETYHPSFGTGGYCLDGNEWIITKEKGIINFKQIKDIKNNSEVLSYNNRAKTTQFKKITKVSKRTSETLTFNITGNHKITVTPDHIMYLKKNRLHRILAKDLKIGDELPFIKNISSNLGLWKKYPYLKYNNKSDFGVHIYLKKFSEFKNLKIKMGNDGGRIIKTGIGNSHQRFPYSILIDDDFAELIGLYISEGCVTKDNKSLRTYITLNKNETETINFVKKTLEKIGIQYIDYNDKNNQAHHIRVSGVLWGNLISEFVGNNSYDSKIHPFFLFNKKRSIKERLLKGIINGDGYFNEKTGIIEYYTISQILSQQVLLLSRSLGLIPILKPNHNNSKTPLIRFSGEVARKMGLRLFRDKKLIKVNEYIKKSKNKNQKLRNTENKKTIIKSITRNKEQIVYGIDVDGNNNFITTGGLIVHNCIPLAPQYVLEGAKYPEKLTLLKESLKTDFSQPKIVADSIIKRGSKKIAILGITYTGDLKVTVLSPAIPIAKILRENGLDVKINDPYHDSEEIKKLTGCEEMKFPEGLSDRDTILIVASHMKYKHANKQNILNNLGNVKLIIDNMGVWNDVRFPDSIKYYEAGNANWL